jgi:membrane protein implicated in regulation of membrane protease activity
LEAKEERLTRASRGLAGAGGGLLLVGGIAYGVTGAIGALAPICIGGFLLLIALFVLAARTRRRRQLEEERARLKSTDDQ